MLRTLNRPKHSKTPDTGRKFYVSNTGSDTNNGRSPETAWATTSKAGDYLYNTGLKDRDKVLFKSLNIFEGQLYFDNNKTAISKSNVFSTYGGDGKATIHTDGLSQPVFIYNQTAEIRNLALKQDNYVNSKNGIEVYCEVADANFRNFRIVNCEIEGCDTGIFAYSFGGQCRFSDLAIVNCKISKTKRNGINISSGTLYVHNRLIIRKCQFSDLYGYNGAETNTSGNAVILSNCKNSLIDGCFADGANSSQAYLSNLFWFYQARNCTIQNSTAINNKGQGPDRGGFGLDIDCSDCTIQGNFAFNCEGQGIYLNHGKNNTVRNNIIVDCGINPPLDGANPLNHGGIYIYGGKNASGTPPQLNARVYNNTVISRAKLAGSGYDPIPFVNDHAPNSAIVTNNIFYSTQAARKIVENTIASPNIRFYGNVFFATAGTPQYNTSGTNYSGLSAWRTATGQELLTGTNYGQEVDPLFANSAGNNPTDFKLQASSTLGSGLDLTALFAINPGLIDFFKNSIATNIPGIGADSSKSVTQYATPNELTQLLNTSLAYWRLDASPWSEAKGVVAYQLSATGTIATGTTLSTGSTNSASIGGSTSNLNLSDTSLFHLPDECTIVLPFQKTLSTATNGTATLIGKYDAGANQRGWHLQLEYPSGQSTSEQIQFQYSTNGQSATQLTLNSGYFTPRNGKHLVVFQRSVANNFLRLSIDNGAWVTTTSPASIHQSTARFAIGGRYNSGAASGGLTGLIDNTGIWNYLLTASQLNQFWNSGNFRQL